MTPPVTAPTTPATVKTMIPSSRLAWRSQRRKAKASALATKGLISLNQFRTRKQRSPCRHANTNCVAMRPSIHKSSHGTINQTLTPASGPRVMSATVAPPAIRPNVAEPINQLRPWRSRARALNPSLATTYASAFGKPALATEAVTIATIANSASSPRSVGPNSLAIAGPDTARRIWPTRLAPTAPTNAPWLARRVRPNRK